LDAVEMSFTIFGHFIYAEEDIDWNTLLLMNDDSLKSVIPKAGSRARLMNCLRQV